MHAGGQTDAMFAAFSDGDVSKPPAGSRLMQYMQGGGQQRVSNGWTPSTSAQAFAPTNMGVHAPPPPTRLTPTGQFVPPPPFNFANMSLDSHHNHNVNTDKMPMPPNAGAPSMFPPLQRPLSFPEKSRQNCYGMPPDQRQTPSPSSSAVPSTARSITRSPVVRGSASTPDNPNPFVQVQESVGGTTYFFQAPPGQESTTQEQQQQQLANNARSSVTTPGFFVYTGPLPHIGRFRPKGAGVASFFAPHELKMDLLNRQLAAHSQVDPSAYPDLPTEIEGFHHLVPLEPPKPLGMIERNFFGAYMSSVYKAVGTKDGLPYCLRRLHNSRLAHQKSLTMVDLWKKLVHAHVVQLREVFSTKHFGDYSLMFIYDYHPLAETLKVRHFGSPPSRMANGSHSLLDDGRSPGTGAGGPPKFALNNGAAGGSASGGLPESLIWTYVVQLSSALRAIHAAGMAARTMDPSKILIVGKSKLMINCCGIVDVLTFDATHPNMMALIQHQQQEDLVGLGRLVVALGCGTLQAAMRESLPASMQFIAQHYSPDMKNLVTHLLAHPQQGRPRSINDIMPMIGARFYAQLEASQMRNDLLENELAKEIENGRLFRLLSKLGAINERPEYNLDPAWSETGDRYLLKLFRDYLFHQVTEDGKPWLDLAHVVQCLNKLDAGVAEKIQLMSRDGENVLVVSYTDLRRCMETTFKELQGAPPAVHRPI